MIRCLTTLLVSMLFLSPLHASLDRRERPAGNKAISLKALSFLSDRAAKNDEFRITAGTEVLLDGKPCRYNQVPDGATIVLLETVTNESKEISRIHFRSPKRSSSSTTSKSR